PMTDINPTPEQIRRLVEYLPKFQHPDFVPVIEWLGGDEIEPGVISIPHPRYDEIVLAFMHEASQICWSDVGYTNSGARAMLDDPSLIAAASIDQIKSMLTLCVRSERFCDGAWETIFENGYLPAILERLHHLQ
ncbi:DUF6508 domain-containing protein, partial [Luteimonas sp. 50]